ncbi:hypothetical protein BAE44_0008140 [Dichanthelium oligosanthes]|uniref:Retrotransposon Copia-like N-terminal domain-containing protein n=1 Tax=Dichanthelium oligosanthes TaxID=888268 RepID=A0A1E5W0Q8_9POAL|nr:hypothetical protein BAE44_0008140 [Dichanthelium oligosanthes]
MASLPIRTLDGAGGYLRWKESLLLRAHSLGVARVLFDARPAGDGDGDEAAAKKWAHDDAVCRGHILTTLSDRLLLDYAHLATAAELWHALERTYDVKVRSDWLNRFNEFYFDQSTGDVSLEQLAHAEALGAAAGLGDDDVAFVLCEKLPPLVGAAVIDHRMELVWKAARKVVSSGVDPEDLWGTMPAMADYQEGWYDDGPKPEQNTASRKRGMSGHVDRSIRRRA